MTDFTVFFSDILSSIASFLWSSSMKWVVASIVLLFIVKIIITLISSCIGSTYKI